ncbi:hypothetical protein [Bradyrhizobium sp. SEMIA]|uniref:hypothetical protein n=1 Tax=Bradyrhizobium sp. SEMIA TaxID=2597515 RepID=UPI00223FE0FE|nr:hypothetical protein [Bradyrhizobium sp. SEMIA]
MHNERLHASLDGLHARIVARPAPFAAIGNFYRPDLAWLKAAIADHLCFEIWSAPMSINWRPAKSLEVLLKQVNDMAPGRDKSSDGMLGDTSHQARKSDHNPDANGVVTALDISHDPAHGVDAGDIAEALRQSQDKRIKYIISNRRIASSVVSPWQWRPYNGANAHTHHVHVSVMDTPTLYDDTSPWQIDANLMRRAKIIPETVTLGGSRCANITATVFGGSADQDEKSAYDGHRIDDVELGVALPFRFAGPRPQVRVTNRASGKSVVCNIVDVGPWNINDPYWEKGARPQAESGTDMRGRRTNGAGIDLTPGAARAISIPGKGVVDWEFVGAAQGPQPNAQALLPIVALLQKFVKDGAIKMPLPANDISAIIQLLLKVAQGQNAAPGSVVPPGARAGSRSCRSDQAAHRRDPQARPAAGHQADSATWPGQRRAGADDR